MSRIELNVSHSIGGHMKKRIYKILLLLFILGIGITIFTINHSLSQSFVIKEEYDVIVIGGEPEGVAAAVSAARNGAKTLLIEKRKDLGGLFTFGMLNFLDIPQGEDGRSVSKGIFEEWHNLVGGTSVFDIERAKSAFRQMIKKERNITLLTESQVVNAIKEGTKVVAVDIKNESGVLRIRGKSFIDATQDGDFAVIAGAPYFIGGEDINVEDKKMAVTLMIHLRNVNWEGIKKTAQSGKFGRAEVTNVAAWGFGNLYHMYNPKEKNTRLRGLNIAKVGNDYYINALQIFGVDGLSEESKKEGIERGIRESKNILEYLQREFTGFENAIIASFPTELYVRETRHILAEYQLPMRDIWTNKDHWDNIGYGAYPVDIQAQTPQDYGYVIANPKHYAIPFRSIIPKEVDGLLVVGRASGFSSIAAGSARVVPTGMVTGEAAGLAAALAMNEKLTFRELSENKDFVQTLRTRLMGQGAFVEHRVSDYPYQGEWYDTAIQTLIDYGLISADYDNDLKVEKDYTRHHFVKVIYNALYRGNLTVFETFQESIFKVRDKILSSEDGPIYRDEAATIINEMLLINEMQNDSWQAILDSGFIDESLARNIPEDRALKLKEVFVFGKAVIDWEY